MAEPIRIYCDYQEFTDAWIDIQAKVTQVAIDAAEAAAKEAKMNDKWWLVRHLATACYIPTDTGAITNPQDITIERLNAADVLVIGWLEDAVPLAIAKRRALGKASARLSSPGSVTATI